MASANTHHDVRSNAVLPLKNDTACEQPSPDSYPFMTKIPIEIRDMIYTYYVAASSPTIALNTKGFFQSKQQRLLSPDLMAEHAIALRASPGHTLHASILDVSRQMREECLLIFIRLSIVDIYRAEQLFLLVSCISPDYLRLISHVSIRSRFLGSQSYNWRQDRESERGMPDSWHARDYLRCDIVMIARAFEKIAKCHDVRKIMLSLPREIATFLGRSVKHKGEHMSDIVLDLMEAGFAAAGLELVFGDHDQDGEVYSPRRRDRICWDRKRKWVSEVDDEADF